ncbi:MAG: PA14 domain-containing protein [Pseudomonadota bacterium]
MKSALKLLALSMIGFAPLAATAEVLTLSPADPQPNSGALTQGLAVNYAKLPKNARELAVAKRALAKNGEPGAPIAGLTYDDTAEGAKVLTSDRFELLGADISGYVKFDKPGTYVLDFLTNDGLEIFIGGQQVGLYDGIHACGYAGEVQVSVPKAGYYPLEATYFQRKGTACLMMEWGSDPDSLEFVTSDAFFHAK